jgi:transitional endoplasmic reticulum ATPase
VQGIRVKGLLMYGPPGVGKTETARVLSQQAGFNFVSLSPSDCKVGWIGHAAANIKRVFAEAREKAPCLIFLDEVDSVATSRGSYLDCIAQEALSQLLVEIDGVNSLDQGIFVVAATNRIDTLDKAFVSRFTTCVEFRLPDSEQRLALLKLFVGKIPFAGCGTQVLNLLASLTPGESGRDLKNLVERAKIHAVKRSLRNANHNLITLEKSDFALPA